LRKTYPARGRDAPVNALDGIDLEVPRGSFFGLLGPNGAGKSTLINILAGLAVKSEGSVEIWGNDLDKAPRRARAAIGIVPQEVNFDPFFSPRELLEFQAGLYGVPPAARQTDALIAAVHLQGQAQAEPRTLSGGMKRRLMVAKAIVHAPPVLVLDEPTAGVDVELRQQLWAFIRGLNSRGVTILLTTHYLEEAEQLCDRIAIIDHGRVVACDETPNLLARLDRKRLAIVLDRDLTAIPEALARFAPELKPVRRMVFSYRPSEHQTVEILAAVQAAGLTIVDLSTEEADLEDLFLQLTRRKV
jgi:ABC-2 type transport system ATP-binding protein